ncbi:MAG: Tad domain-containing protein [Rhizobiaceae bacterium]
MLNLLRDRRGNFAVIAAVAVVPVIGAAGAAIDYSRATNVRGFAQAQADMAALSGAQLGPDGNAKPFLDYAKAVTKQRYGGDAGWADKVKVKGSWISDVDYRVSITGKVPVSILAGVPGFPEAVPISVDATVRVAEPKYVYTPPTLTELDNEAGDYNRIYVYCYDEADKYDPKTKGRTDMTAISDNAGTKYKYTMPQCEADQTLSYRMMNVRLVRDQPSKWEDPKSQRFDYYTDTVIDKGLETFDLGGWPAVETVLCKSLKECKPKSQGGIIPEGKDRKPQLAKSTCTPGKYMYYGWEDRPPGRPGPSADWTDIAWTDSDYDDIRIVIGCPQLEAVEDRQISLVD